MHTFLGVSGEPERAKACRTPQSKPISFRFRGKLKFGNVVFGFPNLREWSHVRFAPNSDHESGLRQRVLSALPPKADVCSASADVRFGPKADLRSFAPPIQVNVHGGQYDTVGQQHG